MKNVSKFALHNKIFYWWFYMIHFKLIYLLHCLRQTKGIISIIHLNYRVVFLFQDEESPSSLTDISLAWLCHNVEVLCVEQENGSLQLRHCPLFPQELADQLLYTMAHEGSQKFNISPIISIFYYILFVDIRDIAYMLQ